MEKSYIEKINQNYLYHLGFTQKQIENIKSFVDRGIEEKLYTHCKVPFHNMKHIEKVLMYAQWIINDKKKKNEIIENQNILFLACLYHDYGRSLGTSNKMHGIVGAKETAKKLEGTLSEKDIVTIELLIETHASRNVKVDFKDIVLTEKEKAEIQKLSDILKDADALDRDRFYPIPLVTCNSNYLRTDEAKNIHIVSKYFQKEYKKAALNS